MFSVCGNWRITDSNRLNGIEGYTVSNKRTFGIAKHGACFCGNFAPFYGIDEEAATGTSNCALACYLFKYGLKQNQYIFEQGYNLMSISKIHVKIEHNHDIISKVYVGGDGYLIDKKSILIC